MRISLSQQGDEIKGTVTLPGDPAFVLEALGLVVETFAKQSGVTPREILDDVYRVLLKGNK